jgi:histidinol dehydrogenase
MKVIEYSSENFWELLDEHLSLRQIETDVKIDQIVKSILEDVKKFGDDKIIQFARDFDKVSIKINDIKISNLKKLYSLGSIK